VCKDFASLCYGLILQNDAAEQYEPKLSIMHGHVFVEVSIGEEVYAVDAWIADGRQPSVLLKSEHSLLVESLHEAIKVADSRDHASLREYQKSIDDAYENADVAKQVWYENEAKYRELAIKNWDSELGVYPGRGALPSKAIVE
jgi:hypothetical protein